MPRGKGKNKTYRKAKKRHQLFTKASYRKKGSKKRVTKPLFLGLLKF